METNRISEKQNKLTSWEKELSDKGHIENEGQLYSFLRSLDEEDDRDALARIYVLLALSRIRNKETDALAKTFMEKALSLNPANEDARNYFLEFEWKLKKDILKTLVFPLIRETDNRTAKKKIAEEYIGICQIFLDEADDHYHHLLKLRQNSAETAIQSKLDLLVEMLKEVIQETSALLKASEDYEQSITGVFYTSVHYTDLKLHLERIEQLKSAWVNLFQTEEEEVAEAKNPLQELNELVGLKPVKQRVKEYYRYLKFQKNRKELGFQTKDDLSLNMVLTGNPGTGKTTIARLLAKIYHELGVLPQQHVIETDRSQLIGSFVGQTEENVRAAVERAIGGVLFIDEAYSLKRDGQTGNDYGQVAIDTLVSLMTGNEFSGKFAVILAGYTEEMRGFLDSNPGLRSRFPQSNFIHLQDYSNDELIQIAEKMANENDYILTDEAKVALDGLIDRERVDESFGNGRTVRNIVLEAIFNKGANQETSSIVDYTILDRDNFSFNQNENNLPPERQLNTLIGLETIKEEMKSQISFIKMQQLRKERGLPPIPIQLHSVFSGNPGTGKTTVAKIYAQFLKECGVLKRGHLIVTSRADFVAPYVGQTAGKTKKKIREALGGVLFIDEAYSLLGQSKGDFGKEVIDTLVDEMTKHNDNLVVVLAGYPIEMKELLDSNPGLRSRFKKFFNFLDYNANELLEIMAFHARKYHFDITKEAQSFILESLKGKKINGNGRFASDFIDEMIQAQALRLMNKKNEDELWMNYEQLTEEDAQIALEKMESGGKYANINEKN